MVKKSKKYITIIQTIDDDEYTITTSKPFDLVETKDIISIKNKNGIKKFEYKTDWLEKEQWHSEILAKDLVTD